MVCFFRLLRSVFRYKGCPVSVPLGAFCFLFMLASLTVVALFYCYSRLHCVMTCLVHVGCGAKGVWDAQFVVMWLWCSEFCTGASADL